VASAKEPAHEQADVRFVLATGTPDAARPEHDGADVRWLSIVDARALTGEANLHETLNRVGELLL
jgi:hypothetical protein